MAFRLGSLLSFIFVVSALQAFPTRIIVIRHAEKPPLKDGYVPDVQLEVPRPHYAGSVIPQGQMRASYLVGYFLGVPARPDVLNDPLAMPPLFADMVDSATQKATNPITYIAAFFNKNDTEASFRPIETITPLFNVIFPSDAPEQVDVYKPKNLATFHSTPSDPMHPRLKEKIENTTGTVVLCWKHKDIPYLIQALGVPKTNPTYEATFPNDKYAHVFYLTFVITYDPSNPWNFINFEVLEQKPSFP